MLHAEPVTHNDVNGVICARLRGASLLFQPLLVSGAMNCW
jgi:hypothetical protein